SEAALGGERHLRRGRRHGPFSPSGQDVPAAASTRSGSIRSPTAIPTAPSTSSTVQPMDGRVLALKAALLPASTGDWPASCGAPPVVVPGVPGMPGVPGVPALPGVPEVVTGGTVEVFREKLPSEKPLPVLAWMPA